MKTGDPQLVGIHLDGQALHVITESLSSDLSARVARDEPLTLDDSPIAIGRLLGQYLALAEGLTDVFVALGRTPEPDKPWWVYHVAKFADGSYKRVRMEKQTCWPCGWSGWTGNSRDYAIYIGTDDPLARVKAQMDSENQPCPGCDRALERPTLFVAEVRDAAVVVKAPERPHG